MRSHLSDGPAVIIDESSRSLDDFETEDAPPRLIDVATAGLPSHGPPTSLSRLESMQAGRRRHSRLKRLVRSRLVQTAIGASRAMLRQPEFGGIVIASLLSIVAIGYGAFLTVTWREPIDALVASARPSTADPRALRGAPVVAEVPTSPVEPARPARPAAPARVVSPRGTGPLTAKTLNALWQQRDTRSLEQAFAGLRHDTLALHRCGMRLIADDRAVARCEGDGAAWTIDFQRAAGRWRMADVTRR